MLRREASTNSPGKSKTKAEANADTLSYQGKKNAQIIVKMRSQKDVSKVSIFQLLKINLA